MAGNPLHHDFHGLTGNALVPPLRHPRERKDCFLETVLGAPRAAVNQEPYVNTGLLQRPKRSAPVPTPDQDVQGRVSVDDEHVDGVEEDPLSLGDQLDISPRIMMRGQETRTRFNGSGIFASLVAQVCPLLSSRNAISGNHHTDVDCLIVPRYQILCRGGQTLYPDFRAASTRPKTRKAWVIKTHGTLSALPRPYNSFTC